MISFVLLFFSSILFNNTCIATIHTVGDSHSYFCFVQPNRSTLDNFVYRAGSFLDDLFDEDISMIELRSIMKIVSRKINTFVSVTINNCYGHTLKINWLGPITMHRVGRDGLGCLNFRDLQVQNGDVVVPTFGEIDCRCHLGKIRDDTQRNIDDIIDELVFSYVDVINQNRVGYQNLKVVILCGIPPSRKINNPDFPDYGLFEDRVEITKKLVSTLKRATAQYDGIRILDIFDLFADDDGGYAPGKSLDGCHVSSEYNYLIKERLISLI